MLKTKTRVQVEIVFNQTFLLAVSCIHIKTSHLFLNLFVYPLKTFLTALTNLFTIEFFNPSFTC